MGCHNQNTSVFIETPSLEKLPSKAKDPNLAIRHGYPRPDANPVFQYDKDIIIIIIIIITLLLYYYYIIIILYITFFVIIIILVLLLFLILLSFTSSLCRQSF